MLNKNLTQKQQNVLNEIIKYFDANTKSPTYQELASIIGVSHVTIIQYLNYLKDKKWIDLSRNRSRSIKILKRPDQKQLSLKFSPYSQLISNMPDSYIISGLSNSLFPSIIVDSSVFKFNSTTTSPLPPSVSNFLASYNPVITEGCALECLKKQIKIPPCFDKVAVYPTPIQNSTIHYLNNGYDSTCLIIDQQTKYYDNNFIVKNYITPQLDIVPSTKIIKNVLRVKKFFYQDGFSSAAGAVIIQNNWVFNFTKHIITHLGDSEIFILWALTHLPVLTADRSLANNIKQNFGGVYLYDPKKEEVCLYV
ncbi:MAG: hypothetical protein UT66_C0053G0007 [candidate division CPR2 bacterium GW2011_GWC1_39_9]|uniref:LexA repressor DNA-binding domain-containing protein n=1 Tax=candidate division CPR2 bacterium GW2011_GWC2_39_10 TaxID=1618345 RepID=A0A0G0LQI0_UNCC2|nr:MAG: hypothetical protein UT18_C0022G0006 [candidate division CPR2 bacterium GW2011_GWC2_39_10]KKR32828.1 MAG: hypothetical protein UT66_C0053G0007 [candidate division CPR2 bacterium GW2011_GWC1_39_9]